jgi:dipeptidyl aminopeptidase/acylaminoacyl peptidase
MRMNALRMNIAALALAALGIPLSPLAAQQKRPLDHADYALWKRIVNETVSHDGHWLVYQLTPGEGDGTLRVQGLQQDRSAVVDRGIAPEISADSRWLVARIAPMHDSVEAAKKAKKKPEEQPKDSLVVLDLRSLDPASAFRAARVKSFKLPEDDSSWMAYLLEKTPPAKAGGGGRGEEKAAGEQAAGETGGKKPDETKKPRTPDGSTLVVRTLADGHERRFENVVDYVFTRGGSALYYTASGQDGAADGVFRVGRTGDAQPVSTGEGRYLELAVSDKGDRVAFVTDRDDRQAQAPAFALYLGGATGAATPVVAPGAPGLPEGWAPSQNGTISFSQSGGRVFFGSAVRPVYEQPDSTPADEKVSVDIWNWKDPYLQPMQLLQADQERKRTYEALYDVEARKVVQLATTDVPTVTVGDHGDGTVALGISELPYRQLVSWDGRYVDAYLVNTATGAHEKVEEKVKSRPRLSPDGKYVTWWDGNTRAWKALDTRTKQVRDLTAGLHVAFYDTLDDHPDLPPAYGSAGWTDGDGAFLAYDAYDIWMLDPTGKNPPRDVTEGMGRRDSLRFRYVPVEGRGGARERFGRGGDMTIPTDKNVILSAFDEHTKGSGFYRDRFDSTRPPVRLISGDAYFSGVRKAEDADVVLFSRETFREFPDIWVTDQSFRSPRKVTDANPQQASYSWGSAELVHWISDDGIPLDGILYKPDGFDPSKKYPMMVYFYERMSDNLHRYVVPAPMSSTINFSFYVSRGYLLFVPDIPYEIGYPGESAVDAVVPGVLSLVRKGFVDRKHIGVEGHSWGGYQIAFMVTRTHLFAAAEAGAPVADMISSYGGIRWGTGMSREFQYEKTQSRIGGSLWQDPLQYVENSPIFWAPRIQTPLLMMHNDKDTAVPWYQGIELFTALRRLHKPAWLIVYNGEHHGLFREQDKKDWAVRMQQFFDHYLKGAPAPVWLQEGVPAVEKGRTLGLELETGKMTTEHSGAGS